MDLADRQAVLDLLVIKDHRVLREILEPTELRDQVVNRVLPEHRVLPGARDLKDQQGLQGLAVLLGPRVDLGQLVQLDPRVQLALPVLQDRMDKMERLDLQEDQELLDLPVCKGNQGRLDQQANKVRRATREVADRLGPLVPWVTPALRVKPDLRDPLDNREFKVKMEHKVQPDLKVIQEPQGSPGPPAPGQLVSLDLRVPPDHRECRVRKEPWGELERRVPLGQQEPGSRERREHRV